MIAISDDSIDKESALYGAFWGVLVLVSMINAGSLLTDYRVDIGKEEPMPHHRFVDLHPKALFHESCGSIWRSADGVHFDCLTYNELEEDYLIQKIRCEFPDVETKDAALRSSTVEGFDDWENRTERYCDVVGYYTIQETHPNTEGEISG